MQLAAPLAQVLEDVAAGIGGVAVVEVGVLVRVRSQDERPLAQQRPDLGARAVPHEVVHRERPQALRVDPPRPERLHDRDAIAQPVLRHDLEVRRDERAEIVAEREIDRRAVVERPHADRQQVAGGLRGLVGEPFDQVGMQRAFRQHAAAARGDADEIDGAPLVDPEKRIEHGGDEDRAALVGLLRAHERRRIGLEPRPGPRRRIDAADRAAQRPVPTRRLAELDRQLGQQVARAQVAAGPGDLVAQHAGQREVLEQRDQVGEGLVERERVRIARVEQGRVDAVEDRVRRLVGHDVLGQAREHGAAGIDASRIGVRGREVAEEQRLALRIVERVLLPQRVRVDAQLTDIDGCVGALHVRRPQHAAPEGVLEVLDRPHRHRVHHLLVELRVGFGRREPALGEQGAIVEVDGLVEASLAGS